MTQHAAKTVDPAARSPRIFRIKDSRPNEALPPVAQLLEDTAGVLHFTDLHSQPQQIDYRRLAAHDPMPIPLPVDRENYGTVAHSAHYWATGYGDWLNVKQAVDQFGDRENGGERKLRLLDFGCATGRFLRHVWTFGREQFEPWGCDFSPQNVEWVRKYLTPEMKVVLNTTVPHLPFPDGYFDVVTAFSVFTHIDELEEAWLLELRRLTADNGLLYITVQNEAAWQRVATRPGMLTHLLKANQTPGNISISEHAFQEPMPHDRIVLKMSHNDVYNQNVWHSSEYVRSRWARFFEVVQIADNAHTQFQSPVILRPHAA